jgi:FkbM family methyltransferase
MSRPLQLLQLAYNSCHHKLIRETILSYRFYGQFEPSVDRFIFERYFPDTDIKGTFVECGSFDGLTECSCKFFEETMGWTGYNIEPVPWVYEKLCVNRPNAKNFNFALSNSVGEATFKAVDHPQFGVDCTNGSLTHTSTHEQILEQAGCKFIEVPVKLFTWRDFIQQQQVPHVDLFVLDVEGHEFAVLDGMEGCSVMPDVMCVEVGHLSFTAIRQRIASLGYVYDISSHVNAFFVRQDKLALFAHRRAVRTLQQHNATLAESARAAQSTVPISGEMEALQMENAVLQKQLSDVTALYNAIISSKAWRLAQTLRHLIPKSKP